MPGAWCLRLRSRLSGLFMGCISNWKEVCFGIGFCESEEFGCRVVKKTWGSTRVISTLASRNHLAFKLAVQSGCLASNLQLFGTFLLPSQVLEHEKEEPIHSLPDKGREARRTVSSGSVARSKLTKTMEEQQANHQIARRNQSVPALQNKSVQNATLNHSNKPEGNTSSSRSHFNVSSSRYGSEACPCIGFDNLEGEAVTLIDGKMVKYPADLGGSCDTWDDGVHPQCTTGKEKWCAQPWCYVDPRQCKLDILPTMSSYMPTARCWPDLEDTFAVGMTHADSCGSLRQKTQVTIFQ